MRHALLHRFAAQILEDISRRDRNNSEFRTQSLSRLQFGMSLEKYRAWDPDRVYLFPPAMQDWLEEEARKAKAKEPRGFRHFSLTLHATNSTV